EIGRQRRALAVVLLELQRAARLAVAAQFQDVHVGAAQEQVAHEGAATEGMAVLRPARHQEERLAEDGLGELLRHRRVAGDLQKPAVVGARAVDLFSIKRLPMDAIETGARRVLEVESSHALPDNLSAVPIDSKLR